MPGLKNIRQADHVVLIGLQYAVFGGVILLFAKDIFVPISFALLISFVLYPVCRWLEDRGWGKLTAIVAAISILMVAGLLLVALLVYQFIGFLDEWTAIQAKLETTALDLSTWIEMLGISKADQQALWTRLSSQAGGNLVAVIRNTVSASAFSIVMLVLIPVYAVLILYYRTQWIKVVSRLLPTESIDDLRNMLMLTVQTYYRFIKGMATVYLLVGILNSLGLLLLGVPHAILFGFIASVLTFVPYVGIIVGALLPMALAWITYDSVWYPLGVVGVFSIVQYLEANIIFPVAVSSRLNVNTLVMLVAIFAGGILWGVAGMILFVPFAGIAKLLADHNARWRTLALMLGTD